MQVQIGNTVLEIVEGDIAEQDTDAVVTAAHWNLNGGTGTDGSIHSKAGPELLAACREIGGCPIGDAVVTKGYRLKARYVIHAVGPVYEEGTPEEAELLRLAYRSGLQRAAELGLRSISIPSISTGAFIYPLRAAAPIAVRAIVEFLREESHRLERVRLVLFPREQPKAHAIFSAALAELIERPTPSA